MQVPSVMGLLEARESAARVRVEELRAETDRVRAELAEAEVVLERRVVALAELAEALVAGAVPQEGPAGTGSGRGEGARGRVGGPRVA
ncbi:hypothetical protein [Streptomyces sp. NPDC002619]|uniref:hypothetical protein n=1 Tax=Streptomyces sp. NPDC002619 TaxID=3364655 RepID=UPI00367E4AD2